MKTNINGTEYKKIYVRKKPTDSYELCKKAYVNGVQVYSAGNNVTYYVDSGKVYTEEVEFEKSCLSPKTFTPSKSGWTFVGWREDKTASGDVLTTKVMGDNPIILYAVFSKVLTQTFISYNNTETAKGTMYYNNGNDDYASIAIPSGASYHGWEFVGWSRDTSANAPIHLTEGHIADFGNEQTYYGCYEQTVTLKTFANGSEYTNESKQRYYNAFGNFTTPTFTVSAPTKSGATFNGWSTSESSTTVSLSSISNSSLAASATYYAVFTYENASISRQFYQKHDPFFPNDAEKSGFYMTLVSSVDLSKYSGITIAFDSVGITQDWTTNTVYLTAKCGGGSVDLYSDYYDYTETHHKTETSGSKTLNFTKSSGTDKCIIVFRGGGYCNGGSFGASGTLLGRTVVG